VANRLLEYLPEGRISDLLVLPLLGRAEPWQPRVVPALEPKSGAGRTQTVWLLKQPRNKQEPAGAACWSASMRRAAVVKHIRVPPQDPLVMGGSQVLPILIRPVKRPQQF